MRLRALALIVLCGLWSCSGGGGTQGVAAVAPTTGTTPVSPTGPAPVAASARFTITVPAQSATTSSSTRTPKYVSPATQSIIITLVSVDGVLYTGSPASIATNLSTLNPACTGTTSLSCTVTAPAVVGSDVFSVVTYDTAQSLPFTTPTGNVLSRASLSVAVVAGPNVVTTPLVLNGVPASFSIVPPAGTAGTAFSAPQAVIIAVKDAAGNTIIGTYENSVTLADNDTSAATTLATSGSDSPPAGELLSSSDTATLNYTGLAITPVTITASATGATQRTGTFTPTLQSIVYSGPLSGSTPDVQLGITSGSFSASEVGWTNAPYSKNLTATAANNCSTIGSVSPGSGTSFTAAVAGSPTFGNCAVTLADGTGQTLAVTLTTPAIGIPASLGSNEADGTTATTITVTATQAVPAGSAIIVISDASPIFGPQATGATCADSAGNAYSVDVTDSLGIGYVTVICSAHAIANPLPLGGTITVSWSGTAPNGQLFLADAWSVTGLAGSPLDHTASAAGTGSSVSSGATATTAQANELLFGAIVDTGSTVSSAGFTPGTNGTASNCATTGSPTYSGLGGIDSSNPPSLFGMYCIVNNTGTYSANVTLTGNPFWQAVFATYKGATP